MDLQYAAGKEAKRLNKKYGTTAIVFLDDRLHIYQGFKGPMTALEALTIACDLIKGAVDDKLTWEQAVNFVEMIRKAKVDR